MRSRKSSRKRSRSLCGELGPGDGIDPRLATRGESGRPGSGDPRARRLCHQVARTLNAVLAAETGDETLRDLMVVSVAPAPSVGHLLVTVRSAGGAEPGQILTRLAAATGRLRSELAASISRRRVPTFAFRIAVTEDQAQKPAGDVGSGG